MQTIIQIIRAAFQSGKLAFALVGPKGSLKSAVAREAPDSMERKLNYSLSLYPDMTSRDLLMTGVLMTMVTRSGDHQFG